MYHICVTPRSTQNTLTTNPGSRVQPINSVSSQVHLQSKKTEVENVENDKKQGEIFDLIPE